MNRPLDPSSNGALIRVRALSKVYDQGPEVIPILRAVNLDVFPGEMVAIMGPSGSGKSTLLFILGLFLSPSEGQYFFEDREVLKLSRPAQARFRREKVGFVFQSTDLLENSNVYENLEFPLIYAGVPRQDRARLIMEALERVNLTHRIRHPANLLSGGERQRVAVARALVNKPRVVLADEPTGQLDRQNTQVIMDHFQKIILDADTALVMVTHDPDVAARCTRIISLNDGSLGGEEEKPGPPRGGMETNESIKRLPSS
ncbi:MAG: ABC transporter ATP-binding protein [Thermodesulfobacteriota bacterium]